MKLLHSLYASTAWRCLPIALVLILSDCFLPRLSAQSDGDHLFDPAYVHEIRFESPDPAFFQSLVDTWLAYFNEGVPYLPVSVRMDGELIDSVGVRVKGGFSSFDLKKPLKVDFNRFVSGRNYDGIQKFNLQNGNSDPAVQRDLLGYHIFRLAGVKSPRAAYARVYFNGEYHGVYTMVEQVDRNFLRNQFASDTGTLYKGNAPFEVVSGDSTFAYYNEMNNIANNLTGPAFVAAIEQVLDTDAFLRYFLVENFINAKDNPIDVGVNFYLYRQPGSGKLYWIPWDLNFAFSAGTNYPLLFEGSENAVYLKMLQTPVYRARYLELACEMLDYLLDDTQLKTYIDQNAALIRTDLMTDPRYPYSFDKFDPGIAALKNLMTTQRQVFVNGLAAEAFNCPPFESPVATLGVSINEFVASNDSIGGIADPAGDYPDWIELYNNTGNTVSLKGCYLSNDADAKKHWPFPANTTIAPGAYLMVWADRDITETGLHTDFKLDKKGGQIFLTFEDFTVIDSANYGVQTTNVAMARMPNGIGSFMLQAATFGQSNAVSGTEQVAQIQEISVYPNPCRDILQVSLPKGLESEPVMLQLLNVLGQVVRQQAATGAVGMLDVQNLPEGAYYLVATFGNSRAMRRQVIIHK